MKRNPILATGLFSFYIAAQGQTNAIAQGETALALIQFSPASAGWVNKYRSGESALAEGRTARWTIEI
jgi:hypothetical protein